MKSGSLNLVEPSRVCPGLYRDCFTFQNVRTRGSFSKLKGVGEQKSLGNTALDFHGCVQFIHLVLGVIPHGVPPSRRFDKPYCSHYQSD